MVPSLRNSRSRRVLPPRSTDGPVLGFPRGAGPPPVEPLRRSWIRRVSPVHAYTWLFSFLLIVDEKSRLWADRACCGWRHPRSHIPWQSCMGRIRRVLAGVSIRHYSPFSQIRYPLYGQPVIVLVSGSPSRRTPPSTTRPTTRV